MLELHGWGETQDELNALSRRGFWTDMAERITPEMLDVFAVRAPYDEIGEALGRRCAGIADRTQFLAPWGEDRDAWRATLAGIRAAANRATPA